MQATGVSLSIPEIVLPIGISFITFQKIAFLVDAYRREVKDFSLLNFSLFVTFFPQLIAGPIVHHSEVMPQFANPRDLARRYDDLCAGTSIFCVGLFKKVIIADQCAIYADRGYNILHAGQSLDFSTAWISVFAYSFQLYFDFSGYSDMAVGLARMFGIRLPANFHSPYKAQSIISFWQRWHMTLSRFLRDYLYIPLGGNRKGQLRRYLNLFVVMLLGGLWHGANWTFAVWGAVHGALLAINHAWRSLPIARAPIYQTRLAAGCFVTLTFLLVTLSWVPFRAHNLAEAGRMMATLFPVGPNRPGGWYVLHQIASLPLFWRSTEGLVLVGTALIIFFMPNSNQIFARFNPVLNLSPAELRSRGSLKRLDWRTAVVLAAVFMVSALSLLRVSPFLYFQF